MTELTDSIVFRIKLLEVVLSVLSIVPFFGQAAWPANSALLSDLVLLTIYGYLGIGIVVLASLVRSESMSEKLTFYTTAVGAILHLVSTVIVVLAIFNRDWTWDDRLVGGIFIAANAAAYGWDSYRIVMS
ncbi:uncharacterized protein LOC126841318 [Adelges cooleyi]|uniref:uncharacterized protein LOC126841318 n=1 Tax=Adelges cooleyi TaxID=133065 RepID=UPI00217F4E62|nr:uncharacterized protein LOC126841318 [Adelges cooleyi]